MLRSRLLSTAAGFYGGMAALAVLWSLLAGRPLFWVGAPPAFSSVLLWGFAGVAAGVAIVLVSNAFLEQYTWAKELAVWFSSVLGPISAKEALVLALLSGFAEEMLFRGAMQPTLGLIPTTIVFGLLHWPPRPSLRPWTAITAVLGLVFGIATAVSGHLTFAIVAHFVINFVNLTEIGKMK